MIILYIILLLLFKYYYEQKELSELNDKNKQLELDIETKDKKINNLEEQIKSLKNQISSLNEMNNNNNSNNPDITVLQNQLKEKINQLSKVENDMKIMVVYISYL